MFSKLDDRIKFVEYMNEDDEVYGKIQETGLEYKERNLDEDEANEKAWDDRKFLLKKLLRKYYNVIEEEIDGQSDDEKENIEDGDDN